MSEIIKSEAVVLSKMDFKESSSIVTLLSKEKGKISVIIKGGRSPRSKLSLIADPPNHILAVMYMKESRDIQLLSSAELISHFPNIKSDLERLRFSFAVLELIKNFLPEHEENRRMFEAVVRILSLFESSDQQIIILFNRFFFFFLKEIGIGINLVECGICSARKFNFPVSFNYRDGIICDSCSEKVNVDTRLQKELFDYFICLKFNKNISDEKNKLSDSAIAFMEKYLKFHYPDFKGIRSIQLYNKGGL